MKMLAFIPARAGSKRIPGKNIRPLHGRPLIAWTTQAAKNADIFDRIVVSSDDEAILKLATDEKLHADRRPPELGGDSIRFIQVLEEFLNRAENRNQFDAIAVLLPTCPFRNAADIIHAAALYEKNPEACVMSIAHYEFPPDFACDYDKANGVLTLRHPEAYARSTQSQSVPPAVHPNGAIYIGSVSRILNTHSFFDGPLLGFPMSPEASFDIDHPHQWDIAEALAAKYHQS